MTYGRLCAWSLSQVRICRPPPPPPLSNGQILMKDAQCAETNEKQFSVFCELYFLRYGWFCTKNCSIFRWIFSIKSTITQKKKSQKSENLYFIRFNIAQYIRQKIFLFILRRVWSACRYRGKSKTRPIIFFNKSDGLIQKKVNKFSTKSLWIFIWSHIDKRGFYGREFSISHLCGIIKSLDGKRAETPPNRPITFSSKSVDET